jgi:hypothetical protein
MVGKMVFGERILIGLLMVRGSGWLISPHSYQLGARIAHGLAPEVIEEFLAELAALIEPVEVHFQWRPQSRDLNDEMVLEAAINGRADALVTYTSQTLPGPLSGLEFLCCVRATC